MRIAQIAPIVETIPPKKYGGTERIVYYLCEELVKMGHEVTLFASGDSHTSAKLVAVAPMSLRQAQAKRIYGLNVAAELTIAKAFEMQNQFDIIHDHSGQDRAGHLAMALGHFAETPTVVTMHNAFTKSRWPLFQAFYNTRIVSISKKHKPKKLKLPNHIGVVYNGLAMADYPFSEKQEGYLLFVGRMSRKKGLHIAIKVAQCTNLPLKIAAKLDTTFKDDVAYFEEMIKPNLNEDIVWLGEVDEPTRNALMSKALCLLHPGLWREPFGLNLIEAMACGAPVVAFKRGSIPEIIVDQETGYVAKDLDDMITAVKNVATLDRAAIRAYSLDTFNAYNMAKGYVGIYENILSEHKAHTS